MLDFTVCLPILRLTDLCQLIKQDSVYETEAKGGPQNIQPRRKMKTQIALLCSVCITAESPWSSWRFKVANDVPLKH